MPALKIAIVALSLALDVFAVSVGVGMRGVSRALKIRIGFAFAIAEVAMNLIGAGVGLAVGKLLGETAGYLGFAALFGLGCYMIYESRKAASTKAPIDMSRGWGLFVASVSISLDSLGIGFSILYIGVPLAVSLVTIACTSIAATAIGLSLGKVLGKRAEDGAELWAGVILAATGIAFASLKALGH
jgi:putative Mn2+ efflux pump MntP